MRRFIAVFIFPLFVLAGRITLTFGLGYGHINGITSQISSLNSKEKTWQNILSSSLENVSVEEAGLLLGPVIFLSRGELDLFSSKTTSGGIFFSYIYGYNSTEKTWTYQIEDISTTTKVEYKPFRASFSEISSGVFLRIEKGKLLGEILLGFGDSSFTTELTSQYSTLSSEEETMTWVKENIHYHCSSKGLFLELALSHEISKKIYAGFSFQQRFYGDWKGNYYRTEEKSTGEYSVESRQGTFYQYSYKIADQWSEAVGIFPQPYLSSRTKDFHPLQGKFYTVSLNLIFKF